MVSGRVEMRGWTGVVVDSKLTRLLAIEQIESPLAGTGPQIPRRPLLRLVAQGSVDLFLRAVELILPSGW